MKILAVKCPQVALVFGKYGRELLPPPANTAPTIEIDTIEYQQTENIETEVRDDDRIRAHRCTQHHPGCPSGASPERQRGAAPADLLKLR